MKVGRRWGRGVKLTPSQENYPQKAQPHNSQLYWLTNKFLFKKASLWTQCVICFLSGIWNTSSLQIWQNDFNTIFLLEDPQKVSCLIWKLFCNTFQIICRNYKIWITLVYPNIFRSSHRRCSVRKRCSKKFHEIYRKTTMPESLFK